MWESILVSLSPKIVTQYVGTKEESRKKISFGGFQLKFLSHLTRRVNSYSGLRTVTNSSLIINKGEEETAARIGD